jgi:hypothetical protein
MEVEDSLVSVSVEDHWSLLKALGVWEREEVLEGPKKDPKEDLEAVHLLLGAAFLPVGEDEQREGEAGDHLLLHS